MLNVALSSYLSLLQPWVAEVLIMHFISGFLEVLHVSPTQNIRCSTHTRTPTHTRAHTTHTPHPHPHTHLMSISRSWANSQCFLFSTSMKPHFVCLPRTFFPPTATSRSLPITANGICCYRKRVCVWGFAGECVGRVSPLFWSWRWHHLHPQLHRLPGKAWSRDVASPPLPTPEGWCVVCGVWVLANSLPTPEGWCVVCGCRC